MKKIILLFAVAFLSLQTYLHRALKDLFDKVSKAVSPTSGEQPQQR